MIASITWQFAVEWLARPLGVSRVLGTELAASSRVRHVWPRDKGAWLRAIASELRVPCARVAAVGDSPSDADLLSAASLRYYVGLDRPPALTAIVHRPAGNIEAIAREVLESWTA